MKNSSTATNTKRVFAWKHAPGSAARPSISANTVVKRIFDVTLAAIGLIIAAPLMAAVSLLLKIESSGRVVFSQERIGFRRCPFKMHKFRKFPDNWGCKGPGVTMANDARMTKIGRILERTKLDELPQLYNILKGEMSFVGPRPESTRFSDMFVGKFAAVLEFKPGIFGPNQVAYRNECELYPADTDPETFYRENLFPSKAESDLQYFSNANIFSDMVWIAKGVWISFAGIVNWRSFFGFHFKIVLVDILMIQISWLFSHLLRFGGLPPGTEFDNFLRGQFVLPIFLIAALFVGGCYRHPVRFFSLTDAIRMTSVISLAWLAGFLFLLYFQRSISFSLVILNWLILMPLLTMPRIYFRLHSERSVKNPMDRTRNILIYGAGRSGSILSIWMKNGNKGLNLIGFVDDTPELGNKRVNGHKILGVERDIPTIHQVYEIHEIWVTFIPNPNKKLRLKSLCEKNQCRLVVFPELEPFSRFAGR